MARSLKRGRRKKRRSATSQMHGSGLLNKLKRWTEKRQKGRGFKKPPIYNLVESITLGMLKGMGFKKGQKF